MKEMFAFDVLKFRISNSKNKGWQSCFPQSLELLRYLWGILNLSEKWCHISLIITLVFLRKIEICYINRKSEKRIGMFFQSNESNHLTINECINVWFSGFFSTLNYVA